MSATSFATGAIAAVRRVGVVVVVLAATVGAASPATAQTESVSAVAETSCPQHSDSVVRLYQAAFGRDAEADGFAYWFAEYQDGAQSLPSMAAFFATSPEFTNTYGDLDNNDFVEQLYRNVLRRAGDAGGVAFWSGQLTSGDLTRGEALLRFSESPENVIRTETTEPVLGFYNDGLDHQFVCGTPYERLALPEGNLVCDLSATRVTCDATAVPPGTEMVPACFFFVTIDQASVGHECSGYPEDDVRRPTTDGTKIYSEFVECVVTGERIECTNTKGDWFVVDGREGTTSNESLIWK